MRASSSNRMSSNTSLDNTSDQDYSEFLNEYLLHTNLVSHESEIQYEEGEMEAEWLVAAGFPQLTKPYEQGLELRTSELEPMLSSLSKPHAEAIKQRVRALNHTVRGRTKNRPKRKPDIRDVFRDFDESSTGTRSRSATPDSLDSTPGDEVWGISSIPSFVSVFNNANNTDNTPVDQAVQKANNNVKQKLRRTPSAPLKGSTDIFRGSHVRCDIPMYLADGVELLGFSRIGTIKSRNRSGSDPSCSVGRACGQFISDSQRENNNLSGDSSDECISSNRARLRNSSPESSPKKIQNKTSLDTPPQSLQNSPSSRDGISFENMIRESSSQDEVDNIIENDATNELCSDIDIISETDLKRLHPVFWLELATIFDRNKVVLEKRKPFKRRRKEEGNLFGISLNALIRRDQQITGKDSTLVPLFLEGLLKELSKRGAEEEGILRVAGHKQKTELLYNDLEASFYQKPNKFSQLLTGASVHELSAILKRWLRELPQPLLTNELIVLFYQCHALPPFDQAKALAIICQMLPHENRNTLRTLLRFLNHIIKHKESNKMNMHNVATIIAPSFFPPRYIHPTDKNSIEEQVKMAAKCCRLTNSLMTRGELLFQVPNNLIEESKSHKSQQGKRVLHRRVKATTSLLLVDNTKNNNDSPRQKDTDVTDTNVSHNSLRRQQSINPSHVHRIII